MKRCVHCCELKPVDEFYSWFDKKYHTTRYMSWCKTCAKVYGRKKAKTTPKAKAPRVVEPVLDRNREAILRGIEERALRRRTSI